MKTREVVQVVGPQAASYLQGQISQDVDALSVGATAWSLVLQPNGKVVAWFRIHRVEDDTFLLDIDAGHAEALIARLERFKLRTEATISLRPEGAIPTPVLWRDLPPSFSERERILAGMPRMGCELTESTIPGEGGQYFIDVSVSFTKGCYTGQELVARIDSRGGNVPRPIRVLQAAAPVRAGDAVTAHGDTVGKITSADADVALAVIRRKHEVGDTVFVGEVSARIIEPARS